MPKARGRLARVDMHFHLEPENSFLDRRTGFTGLTRAVSESGELHKTIQLESLSFIRPLCPLCPLCSLSSVVNSAGFTLKRTPLFLRRFLWKRPGGLNFHDGGASPAKNPTGTPIRIHPGKSQFRHPALAGKSNEPARDGWPSGEKMNCEFREGSRTLPAM